VATTWGFAELAFPIYLIVINALLVFSVSKRKVLFLVINWKWWRARGDLNP
jgi:hypothetical protein